MEASMSHEIVERGPLQLSGLALNCPGFDTSGIPPLWDSFIPRLGELAGCQGVWGACLPAKEGFKYLAGAELTVAEPLPAGFETVQIPAGKYLKAPFNDHPSKMSAEFQRIFQDLIPSLGLQVEPGCHCLEEYLSEGHDPVTGAMKVNLYVELK
jgi:AraC family transcriptional regulator